MAFSSSGLVDCCSLEPIVWDTLPRKQGGRIVDRIQRVSLLSKVWFWAACSGRHGMPWNPYKTKSNVNAIKINYLIFYQMEDGWKLWNSYYDVFLKEMVQSLSCGHLKKKIKLISPVKIIIITTNSQNYSPWPQLFANSLWTATFLPPSDGYRQTLLDNSSLPSYRIWQSLGAYRHLHPT